MNSHAEIIANWPQGVKQFAEDVGITYEAARKWKTRNAIPPVRWFEVLNAATERGVNITLKQLRETTNSPYAA